MTISTTRKIANISDLLTELGAFNPNIPVSIASYTSDTKFTPDVAIIIPVYNQQAHILNCLESVRANLALNTEIVIIADGCSDQTPRILEDWMQGEVARESFQRITLAVTSESIYETLCDTIGFALSTAPVVIEVQADMTIKEPGFDALLRNALNLDPTIAAISGRGAHTWAFAGLRPRQGMLDWSRALVTKMLTLRPARHDYSPSRVEYLLGEALERLGKNSDKPLAKNSDRLYLHETVMRGPLALNRKLFEIVGGLDCANFFLGNDDHDFAFRAWVHHSLRVGYLPIAFDSPLHLGSTRRKRTPEEQQEFDRLKEYYDARFTRSAIGSYTSRTARPPRVTLNGRTDVCDVSER